jgi:protein-L-isoaspartate O-methyltransferase
VTVTESVWQARLAGFVDALASHGGLLPPEWDAAFRRVPRHVFVPRVIGCSPANEDGLKEGFVLDADHDADKWLLLVYSDRVLMVVLEEEPKRFSSSSRPSVMARFLRLLDVQDRNTMLEIGTGTGYNAALLCERVGSDHVTTIDIDADLVDRARGALAISGYTPR